MEMNVYQAAALGTARTLSDDNRFCNAVLGLAGEGGELATLALDGWQGGASRLRLLLELIRTTGRLADLLKKTIYHGHPLPEDGDLIAIAFGIKTTLGQLLIDLGDPHAQTSETSIAVRPGAAQDEIGDALWYVALAASASGLPLDDVAVANIQKLTRRYPGGNFSTENSLNRNE